MRIFDFWRRLRKPTYAEVFLYVDKENTIYAIPCGWDRITQKTMNTAGVDLLFILKEPYSEDAVEEFIIKAFQNCYKKETEPGLGPLEKYFGVKTWLGAVRGLKFIAACWTKAEGYYFASSIKTPRRGYNISQEEKWIRIGHVPQKGELAKSFYKALEESAC